jgi:hypothetical protein
MQRKDITTMEDIRGPDRLSYQIELPSAPTTIETPKRFLPSIAVKIEGPRIW